MAEKTTLFEVKVNMTEALKQLAEYQILANEAAAKSAELRDKIKKEGDATGDLHRELARTNEQRKAYNRMIAEGSRNIQKQIIAEEQYAGTLKGMRAQLDMAKDALAKRTDVGTEAYSKEAAAVNALNESIIALEEEYGVHTRKVGRYADAAKALREEMRDLSAALVQMKLDGKDTSAEYVEMSNRFAQLRDAQADVQAQTRGLASDTKGLDTAMQGVMVAVGACQAAMKLFDDGTEAGKKAAATMKQLQVVVIALGAAVQIQNALQKQSLVMQAAIGIQTKARIALTKLETAAMQQATGATIAQSVAMKVLNVVMAANPIGVVLTAIVALVAAVVGLTSWLNKSTAAQREATKSHKEYEEYLKKAAAAAEKREAQEAIRIVNRTKAYQDELRQMYENGAAKEQIAKKQLEMENDLTQITIANTKERLAEAREAQSKTAADLNKQVKAYNELVAIRGKDAKATKKQLELVEQLQSKLNQANKTVADVAGEYNKQLTDYDRTLYEQRADAAEKSYNRQRKNLELWQQAQQDTLNAAKTYLWDYTKTEEENAELRWQHEQKIAAKTFALKIENEQKKLDLERKYGKITLDEYKKRSASLQAEMSAFSIQELAIIDEHNRKALDAVVNLAGGKALDAQLADIGKKYQAAAETIKNNTNLAADERAYYLAMLEQKEAEERVELRKQTEERISAAISKEVDARYKDDLRQFSASETERIRLAIEKQEELIRKRKKAGQNTLADEATLQAMQYDLRVAYANSELQLAWNNANEQYRIKREFLEKELEFAKLTAEQRAALEQELTELISEYNQQKIASFENYAQQVMDIAGSINEVLNNLSSAEVSRVEAANNAEKEKLDKRLNAGLISQKKYDKEVAKLDKDLDAKKAEIARKQAIREKAMSALQIGINTAAAIMKIWAEVPKADFGISTGILTALAAAAGAAQLAAVLSAPIPTARIGGRVVGATHEQGGVLINTEDEERIISANPAKAFPELLNLISYIGKHSTIPNTGYASRTLLSGSQAVSHTAAAEADYDLLAQKVGQHVAEQIKGLQIYTSLVDIRRADEEYTRIVESAKM